LDKETTGLFQRGFDFAPGPEAARGSGEQCKLPRVVWGKHGPRTRFFIHLELGNIASAGNVYRYFCVTFPGFDWRGWGFELTSWSLLATGLETGEASVVIRIYLYWSTPLIF